MIVLTYICDIGEQFIIFFLLGNLLKNNAERVSRKVTLLLQIICNILIQDENLTLYTGSLFGRSLSMFVCNHLQSYIAR